MKNLKMLRQKSGLSQEKLAAQFHMTQQAIYKYEAGISEPDIECLIELSDYFHTSIDFLVGHTDDARPIQPFKETALSVDEEKLLTAYRSLPFTLQSQFLSLMESYCK